MSARNALAQIAIASGVVGAFEATRVAIASGSIASSLPGAWLVVAGFATFGALFTIALARVAWLALRRIPPLVAWLSDLASEDRRTIAAARALLVALALFAIGAGAFGLAASLHERFRFHDAAPVGLVQAIAIVVLVAIVGALALVADRRIARLEHSALLAGSRLWVAAACVALALLVGPALVVHFAVPAYALAPTVTASVALVAAIASTALPIRRVAALVAIAIGIAALAGVVASRSIMRGRGAVVEHGVLGKLVARALWSLADRDGDGVPGPLVGGADCDDGDPARAPGRMEWQRNGVDDNCSGKDLDGVGERAASRPAAAPSSRPNIVLVTVDALRADHLGAWGYPRPTSPAIDAFANGAVRFSHAYTPGPSTRLALPALHAGRYPSTLRFVDPPRTIAQQLAAAGYDTAAVLCCDPLVQRHELRGFSAIDRTAEGARLGAAGQANADAVAERAVAYLADRRAAQRPFFLWIHFYDPHHPYATPPSAPSFGDGDIDRYDAEIAHADRGIGRVLAALDQHQLAASTAVAIAADHGDEFGEHGVRFHARSLYAQVIHVPLIVRAPGVSARTIDTPVSLVDVAPTLLEVAGVETPGMMNGRSLVPALRGGAVPERPLLVELLPDRQIARDLIAVIADGHKAIWDREANAWTLYALSDSADERELSDEDPARLARLQTLLLDLVDRELGQ